MLITLDEQPQLDFEAIEAIVPEPARRCEDANVGEQQADGSVQTAGAEEAHVVLRSAWMMLRCIRGDWRRLAVGISIGGAMPRGFAGWVSYGFWGRRCSLAVVPWAWLCNAVWYSPALGPCVLARGGCCLRAVMHLYQMPGGGSAARWPVIAREAMAGWVER